MCFFFSGAYFYTRKSCSIKYSHLNIHAADILMDIYIHIFYRIAKPAKAAFSFELEQLWFLGCEKQIFLFFAFSYKSFLPAMHGPYLEKLMSTQEAIPFIYGQ